MHAYGDRQPTCHSLPLSKKNPPAFSNTSLPVNHHWPQTYMTDIQNKTFFCTDYSPSWVNMNRLNYLYSAWQAPDAYPALENSPSKTKASAVARRCHRSLHARCCAGVKLTAAVVNRQSWRADSTRYSRLRSATRRSRVSVLRSTAKPPELLPTPAGARWR